MKISAARLSVLLIDACLLDAALRAAKSRLQVQIDEIFLRWETNSQEAVSCSRNQLFLFQFFWS